MGVRKGVGWPGEGKREEAEGGKREAGMAWEPPRKLSSSTPAMTAGCWGAREKAGAVGKESARLKAPEASRGLEGGRDMVLCNPAV